MYLCSNIHNYLKYPMNSIRILTKINLCVFLFLGILYGCNSECEVLYVVGDGSDLNEGTLNQPFATITKARDVVRELNKQGKSKSYRVLIREGIYYLPETFLLTAEDSGNDDKPVIYTNYKNEKVTISGSIKPDCQWQLYRNGIYKCSLPEHKGIDFSQLFVNGRRQIRARYPNGNSLQHNMEAFIFPKKADEWGVDLDDGSSNSPAFDVGFREFPLDQFGLTQEFENIWME